MTYTKLTALTVGLLSAALPMASAASQAERTRSGEYRVIAGGLNENDPSVQGEFTNVVTFAPRAREHFVTISIEDKAGLPTRALVVQERRSAAGPSYVLEQEICGHTDQPIAIRTDRDVKVLVQDGPCEDGTRAAATFGTVKATFTR